MTSSDLPISDLTPDPHRVNTAASPAELGDVLDSIEDAAATLGRVITHEAESLVDDVRGLIRDQPVAAVAVVGAVAYLLGRLMR